MSTAAATTTKTSTATKCGTTTETAAATTMCTCAVWQRYGAHERYAHREHTKGALIHKCASLICCLSYPLARRDGANSRAVPISKHGWASTTWSSFVEDEPMMRLLTTRPWGAVAFKSGVFPRIGLPQP